MEEMSTRMLNKVKAYLDKKSIFYIPDRSTSALRFEAQFDDMDKCYYMVCITGSWLIAYATRIGATDLRKVKDTAVRLRIYDLAAKLNKLMVCGHFEPDFETGELRYSASLMPGSERVLSYREIERTIIVAGMMLDQFGPAFEEVMLGDAAVEEEALKRKNRAAK